MSDPLKTRLIKLLFPPLRFAKERAENLERKDKRRTYTDLAKATLVQAFPPIGYDIPRKKLVIDSSNKYNSEDTESDAPEASPSRYSTYGERSTPREKQTFYHNWTSFFTTFFGLPNRANGKQKITGNQLAQNFIGGLDWKINTPASKKLLQVLGLIFVIKSIIIPVFNLITIVFRTAFNVLAIFTEFLPTLLANASALAMSKLIAPLFSTDLTFGKRILLSVGISLLCVPYILFKTLSLVGRAFSSPRKSFTIAWASGRDLAGDNEILGYVLGGVFAIFSLATTIATWAVLLPVTIHLIPAAVSNFVAPVLGPIYAFLKPALMAVGNFLGPVFAPILGQIGASIGIQLTATVASVGVGLATIATPIATAASKIYQEASNFWVTGWREGGVLRKLFARVDKFLLSTRINVTSQNSTLTPRAISSSETTIESQSDTEGSIISYGPKAFNSPRPSPKPKAKTDPSNPALFSSPRQQDQGKGDETAEAKNSSIRKLNFSSDEEN